MEASDLLADTKLAASANVGLGFHGVFFLRVRSAVEKPAASLRASLVVTGSGNSAQSPV
jgi:hypothetical protein